MFPVLLSKNYQIQTEDSGLLRQLRNRFSAIYYWLNKSVGSLEDLRGIVVRIFCKYKYALIFTSVMGVEIKAPCFIHV